MNPPPYRVIDADQHSMPPHDAYERYIDPKQRDKAVRSVMPPKSIQVTFGDDQLEEFGVKGAESDGDSDRSIRSERTRAAAIRRVAWVDLTDGPTRPPLRRPGGARTRGRNARRATRSTLGRACRRSANRGRSSRCSSGRADPTVRPVRRWRLRRVGAPGDGRPDGSQ